MVVLLRFRSEVMIQLLIAGMLSLIQSLYLLSTFSIVGDVGLS